MQQTRKRFHEELADLEGELLRLGQLSESAVVKAVDALVRKDATLADQIVAGDDIVDAAYLDIEAATKDFDVFVLVGLKGSA